MYVSGRPLSQFILLSLSACGQMSLLILAAALIPFCFSIDAHWLSISIIQLWAVIYGTENSEWHILYWEHYLILKNLCMILVHTSTSVRVYGSPGFYWYLKNVQYLCSGRTYNYAYIHFGVDVCHIAALLISRSGSLSGSSYTIADYLNRFVAIITSKEPHKNMEGNYSSMS